MQVNDVLNLSKSKLLRFKDIHKGKRCVIIGNGPSLNKMDLSFLKNEITFGMNKIFLGFDKFDFKPTYYVSVNQIVISQSFNDIRKIDCPKFLSHRGVEYFDNSDFYAENMIFNNSIWDINFYQDIINGWSEGGTVTFVALQLAYYMGFNEVVLIGVDHNFICDGKPNQEVISDKEDANHFHPDYFGKGVNWNLPDLESSEKAYNLAKQAFDNNNRKIIDATYGGKLTIFEKADYKSIFFNSELNNLNLQAKSMAEAGKIPEAIRLFEQIIAQEPLHFKANFNLGVLYYQQKELKKSVKCYLKCLEINHDDRNSTINCFYVLNELGKNDEAEKIVAAYLINHYEDEEMRRLLNYKQKPVAVIKESGINLNTFGDYQYSKRSHFAYYKAKKYDLELFGKEVNPDTCDLKVYQDLLVFAFIKENVPKGSRLLDVGGGDSRILKYFASDYECWNIDKLEGNGNGLRIVKEANYRFVKDYLGNFNQELPNNYFDLVFSVSALEHVGEDKEWHEKICADLDRVLKKDGFSLHCFDVVINSKKPVSGVVTNWTCGLLPYMFSRYNAKNIFTLLENLNIDTDLYYMPENTYNNSWIKITKKSYSEFGQPLSYNLLWQKTELIHQKKVIENDNGFPKITIVTPSFNQAEFLEETINSIIGQNYPNLEYIIMDGGSTDGSVEIIKKYAKYLTYWQSEKDSGQYWAINEGFKRSTGEIMLWINSDDKLHFNALNQIIQIFRENRNVEWITGRPTVWDENGNLTRVFEELPRWSREKYLTKQYKHHCIQQESTVWKRSLWNRAGAYLSNQFNLAGDLELWVRFFRHAQLYTVDCLIGGFRYHSKQKTNSALEKYFAEADKIVNEEVASAPLQNKDNDFSAVLTVVSENRNLEFRVKNVLVEFAKRIILDPDNKTEIEIAFNYPLEYLFSLKAPLYKDCFRGKLVEYLMQSEAGKDIRSLMPQFNPYCFRYFPKMMINVLSDGRVTTCCFDPYGFNAFADLNKKSIDKIWQEDLIRVMNGDFYDLPHCRKCAGVQERASLINPVGGKEEWVEFAQQSPNEVQLEFAAICNYNCVSCYSNRLQQYRNQPLLDCDRIFENLKPMISSIKKLNLYNHGESLLNKGFVSFISNVRKHSKDIVLELSTNAMLMDEAMCRALIENRVNRVIVSAHGAPGTEKLMQYAQRGADYNIVLENTKRLLELKKELGSELPKVSFRVILFNFNDDDQSMNQVRADAKKLGLGAHWGHYDTDNYHWYLDGAKRSGIFSRRFLAGTKGYNDLIASREMFNPVRYKPENLSTDQIIISTSISPKDFEKQFIAVNSWIKSGFKVLSFNCREEINQLEKIFTLVQFIEVTRDYRSICGKPLVYFTDILNYLKNKYSDRICGFVNSDIVFKTDIDIAELIQRNIDDNILMGHRIDVDNLDELKGDKYLLGYDYFFFKSEDLAIYSDCDFAIGLPWWDYYAAFWPLLFGKNVKEMSEPFAYHLRHQYFYNQDYWMSLGDKLYKMTKDIVINKIEETQNVNYFGWLLLDNAYKTLPKENKTPEEKAKWFGPNKFFLLNFGNTILDFVKRHK